SRLLLYHNYFALSIISINLQRLFLLNGRVSIILTVSPMPHSFFSSCAINLVVLPINFPYIGCFTFLWTATVIVLFILLLTTFPILSFLRFLGSISLLILKVPWHE